MYLAYASTLSQTQLLIFCRFFQKIVAANSYGQKFYNFHLSNCIQQIGEIFINLCELKLAKPYVI